MSRKKRSMDKRSPSPSPSPEVSTNLEIDIIGLRGKNKQLIQANAKLQQERANQNNQITALQEEYFKLNSKYANLKKIFASIVATTEMWFPKQLQLANAFGKIAELCAIGANLSNVTKGPVTQAVKPHIVNGHVLQNPTITLSRFNDSESLTPARQSAENVSQASPLRQSNNLNTPHSSLSSRSSRRHDSDADNSNSLNVSRNSLSPCTSRRHDSSNDMESFQPVVSRRGPMNLTRDFVNMREDDENILNTSEEEEGEASNLNDGSRLVTIQEEDEEEDNSTIRSPNISHNISDRVREIRIYLDPLSEDCIDQFRNMQEYVNRTSSLIGEASSSLLDTNSSLMNDTVASPEQTNFLSSAIDSQNFNFKSSPNSRKSSTFEEASCSSSRQEESDNSRIHMVRRKYQNFLESTEDSKYESTSTMSFCSNISAIHDQHSLTNGDTFNSSHSLDMDSSKIYMMKRSTPVIRSPRVSSRNKRFDSSLDSTLTKTPLVSKVTKRRSGSDENKLAKVIVERLSLEDRLSTSVTPIKKIKQILNTSPITKSSEIKKKKSKKSNKRKTKESDDTENVTKSEEEAPKSSAKKKCKSSKVVEGKTTGKENRLSRPTRAAKPTLLKEPSTKKKLRRSR